MTKLCVKKPFTVLVGVIMVIVLGVISFTRITTDLLPEMSLPYVVAVTTYPGATPEKVESSVTTVLESSLGVVNGVKSVSSTSAENFSMVMLEFEEETNMDSAMVKLSTAVEQLKEALPEEAGSPMLMEITPDMMATVTMGIDMDGMDVKELSQFTTENIIPYLERQEGVASVSTTGLVEEMVEIRLEQDKIDGINDKLLAQMDEKFAEAKAELDKQTAQLDKAKAELANGKSELERQQENTYNELAKYSQMMDEAMAQSASYSAQLVNLEAAKQALTFEKKAYEQAREQISDALEKLMSGITLDMLVGNGTEEDKVRYEELKKMIVEMAAGSPEFGALSEELTWDNLVKIVMRPIEIDAELSNLETKIQAAKAVKEQVDAAVKEAKDNYVEVEKGKMAAASAFGAGSAGITAGETQLTAGEAQLEAARVQYEEARKKALESANLDQLLNMNTLSQLIYAQNFEMPAGYISKGKDQYLLKIGEAFDSLDTLKDALLCSMDGIGDVRLLDVAQVTVIDNADESYAKMNGNPAIVLSIFKSSTAGTSAVSKEIGKAAEYLQDKYEGFHLTSLMDQGDYIEMIIDSVLSNLIWGALLAIIVLIIFLKDVKPTIVVAFSIPLSVLFAIVLMFFSNITINMISLSGLALGVGMLVDNSIVVIENIYRLRNEGMSAGKAAVRGAKQVAGAIFASTLTTICVFLPIVFTDGMTRELFTDMGLTIAYSLCASLVVALTVVPSMSAAVLQKSGEKEHKWFDAMNNAYEKVIRFCLRVKIVPLAAAILLLVFAVWQTTRVGMELIPNMSSEYMTATVTINDGVEKEAACAIADSVLETMQKIEGVDTVGAISSSQGMGAMMGMSADSESDFSSFMYYMILTEDGAKHAGRIVKAVEEETKDMNCEVNISESSMDMSALGGSGMQLDISGKDLDELLKISEDMKTLLGKVEGFEEISNGQEEADKGIQLVLDKDEAMRHGLTVAQIYAELAAGLQTEKASTQLVLDGKEYKVIVVDENHTVTVENLMDHEFETTKMDEEGKEVKESHRLSEFAETKDSESIASIKRQNQSRYMTVTAVTKEGYNTTLLSREVKDLLADYEVPEGYTVEIAGEALSVEESMIDLVKMIALAIVFIYLIMVAQFQSLLSPFIVLFTIPLAFTGGFIGLLLTGQKLSIIAMMGFLVLAGVVVNNGIVFVDYVNQLRIEGMEKREALVMAGKVRMRPILMTALTTILAMSTMALGGGIGSEMGQGMAIVTIGGLTYATLMTLFIIPVMYDIFFRRKIKVIDVGEDDRAKDE